MNCLFCKIIDREIPATIHYEDEHFLVFDDIAPKAPVHKLIIPKKHIHSLNELSEADLPLMAKAFTIAQNIASQFGIDQSGYRLLNNCNADAGQTVFHIHFHLLGGHRLSDTLG